MRPQIMREVLEARREGLLGERHPDALTAKSYLAGVLQAQGKYRAAEVRGAQGSP